MPRSDGCGTHHVRRLAATGLLALAIGAGPGLNQALAQGVEQRGVPAEATAENAVVARERAIQNAQRIAYQRMAAETGISPNASPAQIEAMVESLQLESERSTLTGYTGRYTVRFNAARVAAAGGRTTPSGEPRTTPVAAPGAGAGPSPAPFAGPMAAFLDAGARFGSLNEWVALRRRLLSQPSIGSVEVLGISTNGARLRLGLRTPPAIASTELGANGIVLTPVDAKGVPQPPGAPGWQVGLAGGA